MKRFLAIALMSLCLPMVACAGSSPTDEQTLVDRSTLTVQEMLSGDSNSDARNLLRRAKGVMVCPQILKAGFFIGASGGGCIMSGRNEQGWSNPAFYGLGTGSFGLQFGLQDAQIIFIVLTQKGLQALLDSQFKFGADASVAVATVGAGIAGATTAALQADIVAYSTTRGLFAGVSLDGSLISTRSDWNAAYYGQPMAAQQLVLSHEGNNPGAEPLREMLGRFSGG